MKNAERHPLENCMKNVCTKFHEAAPMGKTLKTRNTLSVGTVGTISSVGTVGTVGTTSSVGIRREEKENFLAQNEVFEIGISPEPIGIFRRGKRQRVAYVRDFSAAKTTAFRQL